MDMQAINEQLIELKDYVKKRFDENDNRFNEIDKRFDEHDKRFDNHDKRFDRIETSLGTQAKKLLDHDDHFKENEERRDRIHREVMEGQDKMMKILVRLDQERTFCNKRFERHEAEIKKLGGFKKN